MNYANYFIITFTSKGICCNMPKIQLPETVQSPTEVQLPEAVQLPKSSPLTSTSAIESNLEEEIEVNSDEEATIIYDDWFKQFGYSTNSSK